MKLQQRINEAFGASLMVALLALAACSGGSSAYGGGGVLNPPPSVQPSIQPSPSPALPTAPPAPTPTPMFLATGRVIGAQVFPPGDTATGGNGQAVDGISCGSPVQTFHIHSHFSLWHNGVQVAFPIAVGIKNPVLVNNGTFTNAGACFYNLHTHDMSGKIHIEAAVPTNFTLGEVFDIWGEPLMIGDVAGFMGPTLIYVDTNEHTPSATVYTGDPRAIILSNHQQITIEVGGPYVYPLFYTWP